MLKDKTSELNTKKKNNLLFMLLVIFLTAIITCISSFGLATWARYRTASNGNITAQIAKWSFKVNGESEEFVEIDLADTILYEHVEKTKIAPGTQGAFNLIIDGSGSEVSIDYYIDIDVTQKPTNMKFYLDSACTKEFAITADNKIQLEDEILLANIKTLVTQTIYWKWEYRTIEMPTEVVLNKYGIDKTELETQYNNATIDEEKEEILRKVNDKIDTKEAGGEVILPVKVTGIQKYPEGFKAKSIYVTSTTTNDYVVGDTATLAVEFTEGVYADNNKTPITEATAPVLKLEFEELTTANNPVAKIATLVNTQLKIATGTERTATFVSVDKNKINYEYTIQDGDKGNLKILGLSGNVYNKKGININLEKKNLTGETITVIGKKEPQIKTSSGTITLTKENAAQYYGKVVTNYQGSSSSATWRLFYVDFDGKYGDENRIYLKADNVGDTKLSTTYTAETTKIAQMNPDWKDKDNNIDNPNEQAVAWLCDTSVWKNKGYLDAEKAEYVIGAPSAEMYIDSYNAYHTVKGTSGYQTLKCKWEQSGVNSAAVNGYQYAVGTGSYVNYTADNTVKSDENNLYIKSQEWWWLASPSANNSIHVCGVDGGFVLHYSYYGNSRKMCPLVYLQSEFLPEI